MASIKLNSGTFTTYRTPDLHPNIDYGFKYTTPDEINFIKSIYKNINIRNFINDPAFPDYMYPVFSSNDDINDYSFTIYNPQLFPTLRKGILDSGNIYGIDGDGYVATGWGNTDINDNDTVFLYKFCKLKDFPTSDYPNASNIVDYTGFAKNQQGTFAQYDEAFVSWDDLISKYGEKIVLTYCDFYTRPKDSQIARTKESTNPFNTYLLNYNYIQKSKDASDNDMLYPGWEDYNAANCSNLSPLALLTVHYVTLNSSFPALDIVGGFFGCNIFDYITTIAGYGKRLTLFNLFDDEKSLIDFLNHFKVPFTFDEESALNKNTPDFSDGYNPDYIIKPTVPTGQGDSEPGGGTGDGDNSTDTIPFPPLIEGVLGNNINLVAGYVISDTELGKVSSYLYQNNIKDAFSQWFQNPLDVIYSLKRVPYIPICYSGDTPVKLIKQDTGAVAEVISRQYQILDCGEITIKEYWGNFLDYTQTSLQLYLPFIGMVDLNSECMNSTIGVQYYIDNLTSSAICMVKVKDLDSDAEGIVYTYDCSIGSSIPISSNDSREFLRNGVSSISNILSFGNNAYFNDYRSVMSSKAIPVSYAANTLNSAGNALTNIALSQNNYKRTGNLSNNTGMLAPRIPYILIMRPRQSLPVNYNSFNGYPSNITAKISDLKGFTMVNIIHLDNINCLDEEKNTIEQLLSEGVYC